MTRTRVLAALLAGLTLAGLGTAATALGSDDPAAAAPVTVVAQTRTTSPTSSPTPTPASPPLATGLTADEAVSRAVAHLGGGTATKVEWETEHGRAVWEVDVRRDSRITEVHVDTATGSVTRVDDDGRGRGRDDRGRATTGAGTTGAGTAATTAPATTERAALGPGRQRRVSTAFASSAPAARRISSSRRCSASAASTAARTAAVDTCGSTARAATRARAETEMLIMSIVSELRTSGAGTAGLRPYRQVGAVAPSAIAAGEAAR